MDELTFAVVGDLHVGGVAEEVRTAIRLVNDDDLDFVLFLGDLTDKPTEENVAEFARQVRRINKPAYVVIGNHDAARDASGFDFEACLAEALLAEALAGPWSEGFTYAFQAKGWNFIVGAISVRPIGYEGPQVNRIKGYVCEFGNVLHMPPRHLQRFRELLDESGRTPTCVVLHVPLVRMAPRVAERGCYAQVRLLEEWQLLSLIEQRPNVKLCLYGHDHFNQAEVVNGRLHLITQAVRGMAQYGDPNAIRILRIAGSTVRSRLIWDAAPPDPPGALGTLAGDVAFEWRIPARPFVYPRP